MIERITSRQNKTVKYIRALSRERDLRHSAGEFVCDGEKLLLEAVAEHMEIPLVLASEVAAERLPDIPGAKICVAPQDILDSITTLKTAQSVIFTCRMKKAEYKAMPCALLLDRLQDTGNLGTIIRTADAFGIGAVFEDGCADIYNPKTVRSAMGSIFRVPVVSADFTELIPRLRAEGMKVYASELYGDVMELPDTDLNNAAVIIGNEGNGVRREVAQLADASVIIPMRGGAESLNAAVAASIFMYKMSGR
ncbi:MAG: RNA methyltransferase [Oscillospiraceae bacterium]|nr:RNA methyltransferase [Oscillospiraceae bacterium]